MPGAALLSRVVGRHRLNRRDPHRFRYFTPPGRRYGLLLIALTGALVAAALLITLLY